jgi:hypothetical protein
VFVVGLVLSILLPLLAVAAVLVLVLRRKAASRRAELQRVLDTEPALRGPESAVYRGSTGGYPKVLGNGLIVLTAQRLLFRKLVGIGIDVALADVTGVRTQKVFNGGVVGNRVHLVVSTRHGEVGYFVKDNDAWLAAINAALAPDTLPG